MVLCLPAYLLAYMRPAVMRTPPAINLSMSTCPSKYLKSKQVNPNHRIHNYLCAAVEAHTHAFLTHPKRSCRVPSPVLLCQPPTLNSQLPTSKHTLPPSRVHIGALRGAVMLLELHRYVDLDSLRGGAADGLGAG